MTEPLDSTISSAIQSFLTALRAGHSPATVRTYQVGLGRFRYYLKEHLEFDPDKCLITQLQTKWAVDCVTWISQGQPLPETASPAPTTLPNSVLKAGARVKAAQASANTSRVAARTTTATYIAAITRFYRWCSRQSLITFPAEELDRLVENLSDLRGKIKTNILSKVPPDEVIEKLLKAAHHYHLTETASTVNTSSTNKQGQLIIKNQENGFRAPAAKMAELDKRRYELLHLRNSALLETLKCTGARVSEVVALTRGDLDATNRRALVVGKGQKERWVYFDTAAWQALQEYFTARTRLMADTPKTSESISNPTTAQSVRRNQPRRANSSSTSARELAAQPVFARHDRGAGWKTIKPLTTNAIRTILWELVEQAELETHITPHKFRHWFATRMLSQTGDLAVTQDLLGHADPGTTRIYAQVSETNKQKAFRQVFK